MNSKIERSITSKILELQDENGCWNVLGKSNKGFPELNYYNPIYKSTLWTLILLADIKTNYRNNSLLKPFKVISNHFWDKQVKIYSIGKSHFPICIKEIILKYCDF